MAKFQVRCPSCRKAFPWDPAIDLPSRCPLPGCDYVAKPKGEVIEIAAPFIRSQKTTRTDASYRELETSSAIRAELAAQAAGVPVSEMSHLKVTNIRDTKEGEIAAMPVVNDVTRQMDMIKQRGGVVGFGGQAMDTGTATGAVTMRDANGNPTKVIQGIEPRAGARAMELNQRLIPQIVGKR